LKALGRIHTYRQFQESFFLAREAGFSNINVDLIFGLPGQSTESWCETLRQVVRLAPEHISAYSLILEEGTPFFTLYREDLERREAGEKPLQLPSEEEEEAMYAWAVRILGEAGYGRYEISNFAKEGFACRHNEGYWTGTAYAGFGLGAASYLDGCRFKKTENLEAYLVGDFSEKERIVLSKREQMEEFVILGLRRTQGISETAFAARFGHPFPEAYRRIIRKYTEAGLLQQTEEAICFTEGGIRLSNRVMAEFLGAAGED
jgi:oxygen-independent coproporphyrinogen-3 oxidase